MGQVNLEWKIESNKNYLKILANAEFLKRFAKITTKYYLDFINLTAPLSMRAEIINVEMNNCMMKLDKFYLFYNIFIQVNMLNMCAGSAGYNDKLQEVDSRMNGKYIFQTKELIYCYKIKFSHPMWFSSWWYITKIDYLFS